MNKYSKEFLMRAADKVEDRIPKIYILCINNLLEYDFEYLKTNGVIRREFYRAIETIAEVSRNYDYVKEVFDLMIDDIKRKGYTSWYSFFIGNTIRILIEGDKDKYEEHILNKLFGNAWKDPDFFLPEKDFLGLPDRFPALEDLLFRNTTFSDNISEELSKKIIKGLKLLHDTIPKLINKYLHYEKRAAFPECAVTKYIKQDLKLRRPCKMENAIEIEILTDHIRVIKYILLEGKKYKYRDCLAEKITQQFSKMGRISVEKLIRSQNPLVPQDLLIKKEERINLPVNFIL